MISAVIDTNVLVSGMGWRDSVPGQIIDALVTGKFVAVTSRPLLDELHRVLRYPKLADALSDAAGLLALIQRVSTVVEPTNRVAALSDEPDNRFLEAAVAAGAAYLVSGDRHLLALEEYEGSQIVTPRAFLSVLPG